MIILSFSVKGSTQPCKVVLNLMYPVVVSVTTKNPFSLEVFVIPITSPTLIVVGLSILIDTTPEVYFISSTPMYK